MGKRIMGMFDTFIVQCPFCKIDVEEQTKSGPCCLDVFRFSDPDLPVWVMQDFDGLEIECYNCEKRFIIRFDFQVIVKSRKLEPASNLDLLELELQKKEQGEEKGG